MRFTKFSRMVLGFTSVFLLNSLIFTSVYSQNSYESTPLVESNVRSTEQIFSVTDYRNPSVSNKSKREILKQIPFKTLSPEAQERVRQVVSTSTMYRRLPIQVVPCEKEMYDFMTRHPETMVNIWELMGVSKMKLVEIKPGTFYLEDGAGTRGKAEYLYKTPEMLILYVFGTYEGVPFPKKVSGSGLVILQNQQLKDAKGKNHLAVRLDAFMQIENDGVEALAKTFQPLVGKVADHNLNQIMGFLGELSETTLKNGIGVANMARRLNHLSPEVQQEFAEVALLTSTRSAEPATMPLQYEPSPAIGSKVE